MSAPVTRRFFSPHNTLFGTAGITTVQSISLSRQWQRLAGQGDADLTDSFQAKTNLQVSGSLVIQDPVQADALLDLPSATLKWDGKPEEGGTPKHIEVSGVSFFSASETDSHNAIDGVTLNWNAYKPDGTDPVTVSLVTP